MVRKNFEKEINLKELYKVMKKRLWMIMLSTVLFGIIGGLYNSYPETPLYTASSRIIISADANMMSTLKVILREPIVLDKVIEELGLNRSSEALRRQINVESVDGSLVTLITVVDPDPKLAADIVNSEVSAYKRVAADTLQFSNIRILSKAEAKENPVPINPKTNHIVYIGFLAGLVLGVGLTFLLDSLDDTIRSERDIQQLLGITMLGQVSKIRRREVARNSKKQKSLSLRGETIGS